METCSGGNLLLCTAAAWVRAQWRQRRETGMDRCLGDTGGDGGSVLLVWDARECGKITGKI